MSTSTPPPEKPAAATGPMDLYIKRHSTPSSDRYGLAAPPLQPVHEKPKTNAFSKSGWVAVNATPQIETQDGDYEDDGGGYDMDIDEDNPSADEDEYQSEDFEEEIQYYAHQNHRHSLDREVEETAEDEESSQPTEVSGIPHQILKIYGSHDHIILTATKTSPLLTPHEHSLMSQIKSRKDEATLGFPSGSHSYHPYLGPSILRNASPERLGQFLNGPELEKIKIDTSKYPDKNDWRRLKAKALWRTLYVRTIRDREIDGILREVGRQEKEREEVRWNGAEKIIGLRSSLYAAYEVQMFVEEDMSWDEILKGELEMKTAGMSKVERREWLRGVYGARWTWYAMKFGLDVGMEEGDIMVRS